MSSTDEDVGVMESVPGTYPALAMLPENALIDENALAKALEVTTRTIRRMVNRGEIPPPVSLGGRSMWVTGRVIAWIASAAEREEEEAKRRFDKIRQMGA